MRKVELRMNEQNKYDVIKELVNHNGNKNRVAKKLGLSRRQIDRLIIKYKEKVKLALYMTTTLKYLLMQSQNFSSKILYYFIRINTMILTLITLKNI